MSSKFRCMAGERARCSASAERGVPLRGLRAAGQAARSDYGRPVVGAPSGECKLNRWAKCGPNRHGNRRHEASRRVRKCPSSVTFSALTSGTFYIAKVRVAGSNPVVRSKEAGQRYSPDPSIRRRGTHVGTRNSVPPCRLCLATFTTWKSPVQIPLRSRSDQTPPCAQSGWQS